MLCSKYKLKMYIIFAYCSTGLLILVGYNTIKKYLSNNIILSYNLYLFALLENQCIQLVEYVYVYKVI